MTKALEFCLWILPVMFLVCLSNPRLNDKPFPEDFIAASIAAVMIDGALFCLIQAVQVFA